MAEEVLEQPASAPANAAEQPSVEAADRAATLEAALAEREARLTALQTQWQQTQRHWDAQRAALDQEVSVLRAQREEGRAEAERLRTELRFAVQRLRTHLLTPSPEVPEELVHGETVAELEEAYRRARELVERVRQGLRTAVARGRVPVGAPLRTGPDLTALSPRDKILLGLRR